MQKITPNQPISQTQKISNSLNNLETIIDQKVSELKNKETQVKTQAKLIISEIKTDLEKIKQIVK